MLEINQSMDASNKPTNSVSRVALASFIGTAIEFYDFYIYATAAALVIGPVFFPDSSPSAQALQSFATFGIAFVARPIGAILFGHFGDRVGRKSTLVFSLILMGVATAGIGLLPGHSVIGFWAPLLLCILRLAQGLGLGGEWGGAALLATENAPENKRALFGMFPQLGPSIGFLMSNGVFLIVTLSLSNDQFLDWGWRIPFILSAVLVIIGLYVRLKLVESPIFKKALQSNKQVKVPVFNMFIHHWKALTLGSFSMVGCYTLFYITTAFLLQYGTKYLGIAKGSFLGFLCIAIVFMAVATPISAWLSDKYGRKPVLIMGLLLVAISGMVMTQFMASDCELLVLTYLCLELFLMGIVFAPMGAFLPEIFPTNVRYTGSSAAYSIGGILGASIAPIIANYLVSQGSLAWVGYYVSVASLVSVIATMLIKETKNNDFSY
ncbi:MFS transporter [Gilliamella sp. wkB112]|uniref:MFS transporter n=1 Tax=Gilliamella sp. wkB112 TaxID=3120257 RepID=UPI003FA5B8F6